MAGAAAGLATQSPSEEAAVERVQRKLLAGKRRFHGGDLEVVEEWAFYAAKDLLYSGGQVGELETAALRAVGIDANDHTTWPFHYGGCDGLGSDNCEERVAEMAAQRFEELEAERLERRERSRRDAERIASGAFVVGQPVLAYYDGRAAVVVKVNKVTVKVRHIGWKFNGYELVERNYSPAYLHDLPARLIQTMGAIAAGQRIEFTDWGGRKRVGEVFETDGPLLQVRYQLASGQPRTAWIDILRLDIDGGRSL